MRPDEPRPLEGEPTREELQAEIRRLDVVRRELRHSLDELREIQSLARTIRSSSSPAEILAALGELLGRVLPGPELGLFLFRGDELEALGDPSIGVRSAMHGLQEEGIIEWVLEEGRPISVPDLEGSAGGRSDLLVPLVVMNAGIGALLVRSPLMEEELTAQQLDLVSFASGQAAMALENSRLVEQLNQSRSQLQQMIDHAPDLILLLDREGRVRYANERTSVFDLSHDRLIGRCALDWVPDAEVRLRLQDEIRDGVRGLREVELRSSSGREAIVQLSLSPLPAGHAGPATTMAILRDLTEQRRLEDRAREAEKLKAVMLAAVTVNHEINNPLTSIVGNLFMLRRELAGTASPETLRRIDLAEESARQIERVAQKLESVNEIKMVKYLGDMEMLDIDLHSGEGEGE